MQASIVDLRYHMNDVLKALDRNESVTILYRGRPKGVITPIKQDNSSKQRLQDHPFFGMLDKEDESVEKQMEKIRGGRFSDL